MGEHKNYSDDVAQAIDREVRGIVMRAYERAREVLRDNLDTLHTVAARLIEVETIDRQEFERLVAAAA